MFVNTNVAALNAWRNLENTQMDMTGVLQQMSSGFRINTAADDPAGLAISQQMQSQIGGLNQAFQNSQSGISMLQTADGALGQIQNILQSMRSLASEAATATMNPTDTQNLQTEMNQYSSEITQITNTTQFNNLNLLGGAFGTASNPEQIQIGANQGQTLGVALGSADAYTLGITGQTASATNTAQTILDSGKAVTVAGATPGDAYSLAAAVTPWSVSTSGDTPAMFVNATVGNTGGVNLATADTATVQITTAGAVGTKGVIAVTDNGVTTNYTAAAVGTTGDFSGVKIGGNSFTFTTLNVAALGSASLTINPTQTVFTLSDTTTGGTDTATTNSIMATDQLQSVTMNSGATSFSFATNATAAAETSGTYTTVAITETAGAGSGAPAAPAGLTAATLAVTTTGSAGTGANGVLTTQASGGTGAINIESISNAQAAMTVIDTAINTLSGERANVGAYQNRLNFSSSDVQTTSQNLTAARGGIMNADMALEMANLSKDQVLMQSGVSMLAQANRVPDALLKLLP